MNQIKKFHIEKNKTEGFWAIPTSGYGHLCDEQPLPYLRNNYGDLTPRLGGENNENNYSSEIIPLPYGKLTNKWPIIQRIFNINRRKINIYWRNIYKSRCNPERIFFFYDQLNYKPIENGFKGESPLVFIKRIFSVSKIDILIEDKIIFKENIKFDYFHLNSYLDLQNEYIRIETTYDCNFFKRFKSSTGNAVFRSFIKRNCKFNKNQTIKYKYRYQIK